MAPPKRPPKDDNPGSTIVVDDELGASEDLVDTNQRRADGPPSEDDSAGSTAFVRLDQAPPPRRPPPGSGRAAPTAPAAGENDGATAFVRVDSAGPARKKGAPVAPAAGENDGATAFVRLDGPAAKKGGPQAPPRRPPPTQGAPKVGLQIRLPDDEPAAAKPKPKPVAAPALDKKGRRGAWWTEEGDKLAAEAEAPPPEPEPRAPQAPNDSTSLDLDPSDASEEITDTSSPEEEEPEGATAFMGTKGRGQPEPEPEPQVEAPRRSRPPQEEAYNPVPADDYEGHLSAGPPAWRVWLTRIAITCIGLFLIGVVLGIAGYVWISRETPAMENVRDYKPFATSKVVTADGTVVGEFFRQKRTVVPMEQIPRVLTQAVTAAEDKDFYKHGGVNFFAILRAAIVDVLSGRRRLGASTITQQVVKNLMLNRDKKLKRKLKEVLLAWRLEKNLSKDDILYLYLNDNNFGKAHYGVEEASLYYFGKHVQDIDLGEAALLAGLPQNPTRLNPRHHPDNAKRRQIYVLDRMLANHQIDQADHDREVEKPLSLPPPPAEPAGAWYLDEVRRQLVAQFGDAAVDTSGWTIEVAMDARLQAAAEQSVQDGLRAVDKRQGFRGAIFKIDAGQVSDLSVAIGKKLAQSTPPDGAVLVADLDAIPDKDQLSTDNIARAAQVRTLTLGGIYAGVVTSVNRADAHVQLAPGVEGPVPFSTMTWARPFNPTDHTPSPNYASDVLSVGDIVSVKVDDLSLAKLQMGARVQRLEFALEQDPQVEGAFAAIDLKTRGVLALVGGSDISKSQFNRATQAKRQPGSSFKPFLYAAAIESGKYTPITKIDDSPEVITDPWSGKEWKPQNFEKDQFDGPITLRRALAESKNTVAVKLLLELGIDKVRSDALQAGLTSAIPESYTAALGTGEVGVLEEINAYATLASQGKYGDPIFIRKVTTRDGAVMLKNETLPEQKMRADVAYVTADMMRSVIDDPDGTAHSLSVLGRPAAGKTGTASEHRDGWFVGFTPSVVAGAWVGFDEHQMMGSIETGGHCAGPIWLNFMRAATAGQPVEEWPEPPPGVTQVKVNKNTGALSDDDDPFAVPEVFISGTEPVAKPEDDTLEPPSQDQFYQQGH